MRWGTYWAEVRGQRWGQGKEEGGRRRALGGEEECGWRIAARGHGRERCRRESQRTCWIPEAPGTRRKSECLQMMRFLQGLLEVGAAVFTCVRHKIYDCPIVALDEDTVRAEGRVMFGREEYCGCGSSSLSVGSVRTWIEWQTDGINEDKGAAGVLPQNYPRSPEAKGAVGSAVKLDDKVALVIGGVSYVEGGICGKGLECVQMCVYVSAGAQPKGKSAVRTPG